MTADEKSAPFETWAIVELMGHVRLAGRLTEESRFGATLGRVDIPIGDQGVALASAAAVPWVARRRRREQRRRAEATDALTRLRQERRPR